jgi:Family of unknown function (DUF6171)
MSEEKLSAWKQWKKNLGETRPWDMLNPNVEHATEEEATRRFDICKGCPELISLTNQCKKCGCIMNLKTKLQKATCPLNKW